MRKIVGYAADGSTRWSDNTPASTGSSRLGGEIVVGQSGMNSPERTEAYRAAKNAKAAVLRASRRVAS